ncbi:MAG TPA: hypothetical protein VHY20_00310 [Pirellulales bacterium]|jgi:hypothetical protein|nr:hypothetical protein [Pirellulales bacterium]
MSHYVAHVHVLRYGQCQSMRFTVDAASAVLAAHQAEADAMRLVDGAVEAIADRVLLLNPVFNRAA